jgi:hypothetical protein
MTIDEATLGALVDRIMPRDHDPGALDLGTLGFVRRHLAASAEDGTLIATGLADLDRRADGAFAALPADKQIALLEAVEAEPWFVRAVTIVAEGFYADPDNGGNDGARSWDMIGYRHRLPDGPSGPPERAR